MNPPKKLRIAGKFVGEECPCFIVAEIGTNHNKNFNLAKKLIDEASKAGVDAVKFQSFMVDTWLTESFDHSPDLADYSGNFLNFFRGYELNSELYAKIHQYAIKKGLICFSTPSHITDIDGLIKVGVPAIKFGSVQITDLPTLKYAAKTGKAIILSTGASELSEIAEAIETIYATGNRQIILLHCTSIYPTKFEQVNLRIIKTLKEAFHLPVGFSDHTLDPILVPIAAVAQGAVMIEKHFTLDRNMKGPDHATSIEPHELRDMVRAIRTTEKIMGNSSKYILEEEKEFARMCRRSIVADCDISANTVIKHSMLTLKRPGYGIPPKFLDLIVGRKTKRKIKKDELIGWDDI